MSIFQVKDANLANVQIGSFWVPSIFKGAFTPVVNYASSGLCFGGKQSQQLGASSTPFQLQLVSLDVLGLTAGQGMEIFVFDQDPSGSTFNDNAAAVLVNADLPKLVAHGYVGAQPNYFGSNLPMSFDYQPKRMVVSDPAGLIWFAFVTSSLTTISTPHAAWRLEVRN